MQNAAEWFNLFTSVYQPWVEKTWATENSRLHNAIRYCLSGEGKRVRATISMMVCEAYGKDPRFALPAAVSTEMIHAYSLAHDDLPCMDDDDLRRGRASLHKAFDEATALLAGDAILTDSFRVLSDADFFPSEFKLTIEQRLKSVTELSLAAGGQGMVLGQDEDMFWTGRGHYDLKTLERIHRGKTGALLGASASMGAIAAGAPDSSIPQWREFGVMIGLAFQALDDLLDESNSTGKSKGKDKAQGKLTFLAQYTNDEVLSLAKSYTQTAIALIPDKDRARYLIEFVEKLVFRTK